MPVSVVAAHVLAPTAVAAGLAHTVPVAGLVRMIDPTTLELIKDRVAKNPQAPAGIDRWRWCLVPASVKQVDVPLERRSALVTPTGDPYTTGERKTASIALRHRVPLRGVPYVKVMRFGYSPEAEIVVYSVE